jgi:hypothetical protein
MFKTLTGVLDKNKNPSNEEIKKIPSFIFCKWLGNDYRTIFMGNDINRYDKIPITNQYEMVKSKFAGKIKNIP